VGSPRPLDPRRRSGCRLAYHAAKADPPPAPYDLRARAASAALLDAVAAGELTPSEVKDLGKLIEAHVRAVEVSNLDERLAKLEGMFS
jgi:hypothetical protein